MANTRLGYVKLKFFTTKIFCNSPRLSERKIFPESPPALRDWGATPAILWGLLFPRIVESQIYGYDKHTQIPADLYPRRVQGVERNPTNPHHSQRADGKVFLRIWR